MASLQHNRFRRCQMSSQWSFCFGLLIPFIVLFARASKCVNARNNILKVAILRVISLLVRNKHQVNFLALYVSEFGPFVAHFLPRNTIKQIRNGIEDIISDLRNDLSLQRLCGSVVHVIAMETKLLWLSERASEHGFSRSEVRFLRGNQRGTFVPRSWQDEKVSLYIY